jgi:hypothetical protein
MWNAQSHQIWQKSRPVAFNLASDTCLADYRPTTRPFDALQKWQQRQAGSRAPAIFPSLRGNVRTRGFLPAVANFVALLIFVCTR